jgi:hypothetical protein
MAGQELSFCFPILCYIDCSYFRRNKPPDTPPPIPQPSLISRVREYFRGGAQNLNS